MSKSYKLVNVCPVFITDDIKKTVKYYVEKLGFKYAEHYDKIETFATIYRDSIEIIIVQKEKGEIKSNQSRYGSGYDAYIDTESLEGIDYIYEEYKQKGVKIIDELAITDYGSYEFVFEDIDGRHIGVGLIADKEKFFEKSNYLD
ncbi:MAG: VOC family protein [Halothermotrichaceae bacterium]